MTDTEHTFDLTTGKSTEAALTSDELTARAAETADWSNGINQRLAELVKAEAERRIEIGTVINGVQFKTDDATMIRLRGLLDAFDAGIVPAAGVTYMTAGGEALTFTAKATVQAIYDTANKYRSDVLEASATLQAMTEIPVNFANDSRWP